MIKPVMTWTWTMIAPCPISHQIHPHLMMMQRAGPYPLSLLALIQMMCGLLYLNHQWRTFLRKHLCHQNPTLAAPLLFNPYAVLPRAFLKGTSQFCGKGVEQGMRTQIYHHPQSLLCIILTTNRHSILATIALTSGGGEFIIAMEVTEMYLTAVVSHLDMNRFKWVDQ